MSKLVDKYKYDLFLQIDVSDKYELYIYIYQITTRFHQIVAYLCILLNDFSFFEASKMEITYVVDG